MFSTLLTSFNNKPFKLSLDIGYCISHVFFVHSSARFRKIFTETENAESAAYWFSLFYKTKKNKKSFVDIGSESGYTNNMPTYVFFSVNMKLMKDL